MRQAYLEIAVVYLHSQRAQVLDAETDEESKAAASSKKSSSKKALVSHRNVLHHRPFTVLYRRFAPMAEWSKACEKVGRFFAGYRRGM